MNLIDYTDYDEFQKNWALGDYANPENGCEKCGRHRVCECPNGKHRCEKCNWSPEEQDYVIEP